MRGRQTSSLRQSSALGCTGMREAARGSHTSAVDGLERSVLERALGQVGPRCSVALLVGQLLPVIPPRAPRVLPYLQPVPRPAPKHPFIDELLLSFRTPTRWHRRPTGTCLASPSPAPPGLAHSCAPPLALALCASVLQLDEGRNHCYGRAYTSSIPLPRASGLVSSPLAFRQPWSLQPPAQFYLSTGVRHVPSACSGVYRFCLPPSVLVSAESSGAASVRRMPSVCTLKSASSVGY